VLEQDVSSAAAARALMAEARFRQGKLDDALSEIRQSIERERKATSFILLGKIEESRNKKLDALDAYTDALKLDGSLVEIRLKRGVLLVQNGAVVDGFKELKAVVASNPSAEAYYYMGVAQDDQGKRAQALETWRSAVSKDPKFAAAHFKIGMAYVDNSQGSSAITHLELAVKHGQPSEPWFGQALYNLGDQAQKAGQKKKAVEAFQRFLKDGRPGDPLRPEVQKQLGKLGAGSE
jgi:tetratricopeptide (TPR) repeat protein